MIRLALPLAAGPARAVGFRQRAVPQAGPYAFLAPCPDRMAAALPESCLDPEGFDRVAFHGTFNAAVVGRFQATLR